MKSTWQIDHGWLAAATFCPSPNFGDRPAGVGISLVVIHSISLPPGEFRRHWVEDFFQNRLDKTAHPYFAEIGDQAVSAHFYIRRNGAIIQFVNCDKRAWHAGKSAFEGRENCNDFSIGIELEGTEQGAFSKAQYVALKKLLAALSAHYPISALAGHSDIAPGRKNDPGPFFDWSHLDGLGLRKWRV